MNLEKIIMDQKIIINDANAIKMREKVHKESKQVFTDRTNKTLVNLEKKQNDLSQNKSKLTAQIQAIKERLAQAMADDYFVSISSDLKKELSYLKIDPPKRNIVSKEECKNNLKSVYSQIRDIEKKQLPNIEVEKNKEKEKLKSSINDEERTYKKTIVDIEEKIKKMLAEYSKTEVKNITKTFKPDNLSKNQIEMSVGNVLFPAPDELVSRRLVNNSVIRMPLSLDIKTAGNIYIECNQNNSSEKQYEDVLTALVMKYINSFPSGCAKLSIFSTNFYSFQKLNALYQSMAAGNNVIMPYVATNGMQLEQFFSTLLERGTMVSGKLLANNCYDIYGLFDKNIDTESFNIVVLQGIFKELNENTARILEGLIKGYHTCGIRFIILDSLNEEMFKYKNPDYKNLIMRICNSCINIKSTSNGKWEIDTQPLELATLASDITPQDIYNYASKLCEFKEVNKKKVFTYEDIGFNSTHENPSFEPMEIPVGIVDSKVWNIKFSSLNSPLANLIIGIPGTGKSTMIDTMIINGAIKYSPDELIFRLLDFKEGNSSDAYANTTKVPHVKMLSLNNKKEEAGIILLNILSENEKRISEFKRLSITLGSPIRSIIEYNDKIKGLSGFKKMPRMVIIIDECQYLFEDEAMAKNCEYIIRLGRSQGIHLVLSTQALDSKMRKTMEFVDGRYIFEVTNTDASDLLPRKYVDMIRTDIPKGSYRAFVSNEIKSQDRYKMQTVHDNNKLPEYAAKIRSKWNKYPIDTVVVGNKERLSINDFNMNTLFTKTETFRVPIGENYIDHSILYMDLNKEKQDSIILLGTNHNISDSINTSLLLAARKRNIETYVVDGSSSQLIYKLSESLGFNKESIGDETQYLSILEKVQKVYEERMEHLHEEFSPVVFVINGAQNIDSMINDEKLEEKSQFPSAFPTDLSAHYATLLNKEANKKNSISGKVTLFNLLNNAYKVGIYISINLDSLSLTMNNGDNAFMSANNKILKNSNYRILFNNVKADCGALLENLYKPSLFQQINENMAFLVDRDNNYYKFRVIQYDLSASGLEQLKIRGE